MTLTEESQNVESYDFQEISPASPFVTTSDVLNQLNKYLSNLSSPPEAQTDDDDNDYNCSHRAMNPPPVRFELQKRLADGSAIRASTEDIAAVDFKTKLEQSAKFVSQLATPKDRHYWAERQRQLGNAFFGRGDYKGAMDIYLTCLVVKEDTSQFVNGTLLPVLNNLSQCTSQLGMHKKTIQFCELAIEEASKVEKQQHHHQQQPSSIPVTETTDGQGTTDQSSLNHNPAVVVLDHLAMCKIHFQKAKALRLIGHYQSARVALNSSLDYLERKAQEFCLVDQSISTSLSATKSIEPYRQAIQKEFTRLDWAEREGRKNHQRQKNAMQRAMSSKDDNALGTNQQRSGLGFDQESSSKKSKPRQYSRLLAPPKGNAVNVYDVTNRTTKTKQPRLSIYMSYYWTMVGRVAHYLLHLLGEEEDDGETNDKEMMEATKT
jgi:tetratricopeptide (TPR) repeat protein